MASVENSQPNFATACSPELYGKNVSLEYDAHTSMLTDDPLCSGSPYDDQCVSSPSVDAAYSAVLNDYHLDVHEWLLAHHTSVVTSLCPRRAYDIFAVAEYPTFASKAEYINASVGIPLGPVTLEVSLSIMSAADD